MHSMNGKYYYCEPQTIYKTMRATMTEERYLAIRLNFVRMRQQVSEKL